MTRAVTGPAAAGGSLQPWLVYVTRCWTRLLVRLVFRLTVIGAEHVPSSGPVLLAGNHSGLLDGPLVYAISPRPTSFLTKAELFVGPLARALGWLGQISVHRGQPDRTALKAGLAVLGAGGVLGVFPEGTRGSGALETTTDGLAYLALRSGAQVVPVAVLGTAAALPRGSRRPRWGAPITVAFGRPVTLTMTGDPRARRTVREAAEQLRLALVAHLDAVAPRTGTPSGTTSTRTT